MWKVLNRYAYSEEKGEDSDGEESEALYSGTPKGDISLVNQERREKNGQNVVEFELEEDHDAEEGKREWIVTKLYSFVVQI